MGKIEKFEDIIAWQKARGLSQKIYQITKKDCFKKDFSLRDQMRRAGNSIMFNIAEGFARRSDKGFKYFLYISLGSAAEVKCSLYVTIDQKYISDNEFDEIYKKCDEVSRIVTGLINSLINVEEKNSMIKISRNNMKKHESHNK